MPKTDPGLTASDVAGETNETQNQTDVSTGGSDESDAAGGVQPARTFSASEVARIVQEAEANASLAVAIGLARAARQLYSTNRRKAAETLAAQVVDEICTYAETLGGTAQLVS